MLIAATGKMQIMSNFAFCVLLLVWLATGCAVGMFRLRKVTHEHLPSNVLAHASILKLLINCPLTNCFEKTNHRFSIEKIWKKWAEFWSSDINAVCSFFSIYSSALLWCTIVGCTCTRFTWFAFFKLTQCSTFSTFPVWIQWQPAIQLKWRAPISCRPRKDIAACQLRPDASFAVSMPLWKLPIKPALHQLPNMHERPVPTTPISNNKHDNLKFFSFMEKWSVVH